MSKINYYSSKDNLDKKVIILRLDLNVPIINDTIQDSTRIDLTIPFLKKLSKLNKKIIIISHLGRPEKNNKKKFSLLPVFNYIKKIFKDKISFYDGNIDNNLTKKIDNLKYGDLLLLENIRFFEGEEQNDLNFAKKLSSLGEVYINDAFSCSHRKQASVHGIATFMINRYAGPLFKSEVEAIDSVLKNKKKPVTCIIGGSKVSTKIEVISNLIKNVENIILVGAMANNFHYRTGRKVGKSMLEKNAGETVGKILRMFKDNSCKLYLPEDCSVAKSKEGTKIDKDFSSIEDDDIILDIGPKTIIGIKKIIDNSNTVLWNGPAGYFENNEFAKGTYEIAEKISEKSRGKSLISVLGGGDTVSAINGINKNLLFSHLSTAGGAFLDYLKGKDLPGVSVLKY